MNQRDSTKQAIDRFIRKQSARENKTAPVKQNKKPERDTEKAVLHWARDNGFFLHLVESSSYDPILRRKGSARAQSGMSDLIGNTPDGLACYIELKAKDRRSTLSESQRLFLKQKIEQNCFAVVVDSVDRVSQYWRGFCSLKTSLERRQYLLDCLPKKSTRVKPPRDKFEEEFGF